jgi:WD40 repeat protein
VRFFIGNGDLSDEDFAAFFRRIDANCDGHVEWDELVQFLIGEITCSGSTRSTDETKIVLTRLSTPESVLLKTKHLDRITQMFHSAWVDEYITVSRDAVKFWQPKPFQFKRTLCYAGPYSCVCVFARNSILVVGTATRKLLFFGLDDLGQLPIEISGSPSATTIHRMDVDEASTAVEILKSKKVPVPLYNLPVQMIEAELTQCGPFECKFIVGDDCGCVEVFCLVLPQRRMGTDYKVNRIARNLIHGGAITQLSPMGIHGYGSSSQDGTVKLFVVHGNTIQVTRTIDDGFPVASFTYVSSGKFLIICGNGHEPSVWSIHPPQRNKSLQGNYNSMLLVSNYVSQLDEPYVVTATSKKELRLYECVAFTVRGEFVCPAILPPDNTFSTLFFDPARHSFFTCCAYPIQWAEGRIEGPRGITHQYQIVGCHYTPDFDQLVSVDTIGNIATWSHATSQAQLVRSIQVTEINESVVDGNGRPLLTSSFEGQTHIWKPNYGGHNNQNESGNQSQVTTIKFLTFTGRNFLVTAGWSKVVSMYREIGPSQFILHRSHEGHQGDIRAIRFEPSGGLVVTRSVIGEVYAWPVDSRILPKKLKLPDESPVEVIMVIDHYVAVGVAVLGLPHPDHILMRKRVRRDTVPVSVSAVNFIGDQRLLLTGDTLGYVTVWHLLTSGKFSATIGKAVHCHRGEITKIETVGPRGNFFATVGVDMAVRLWASGPMECVGTFAVGANWVLADMETWAITSPVADEEEERITSKSHKSLNAPPPLEVSAPSRSIVLQPNEQGDNLKAAATSIARPTPQRRPQALIPRKPMLTFAEVPQ